MLISQNDMILIKKLFAASDRSLNDGEQKKAFTSGVDAKLYPMLKKILDRYIDMSALDIHVAFLLDSFEPWSIHTDYPKGDLDPAIAILIPFVSIDSHTVIFNEECLDDFEEYIKDNPPLDPDKSAVKQAELMSHIKPDLLSRVTILSIEAWVEGKIITWDRKLLHCSDNYKGKGIQSKQAAVIFTSYRNL